MPGFLNYGTVKPRGTESDAHGLRESYRNGVPGRASHRSPRLPLADVVDVLQVVLPRESAAEPLQHVVAQDLQVVPTRCGCKPNVAVAELSFTQVSRRAPKTQP